MKKKVTAKNAFTLIELIIAIAILIVGLVGTLLVIPMAQRTTGRAALTSRAMIVATDKLEELKAKGYDELISQPTWTGSVDIFTWTATVAEVSDSDFDVVPTKPTTKFARIHMEVAYDAGGKQRVVSLDTMYSEL